MSKEYYILIAVWVVSFLLIFTIPRAEWRLAIVAFLFKQTITYLFGLVVVEAGMLEYPIRELPDINRTSLTYEFLAYPMMCAVFNAHYPYVRGCWFQAGYYVIYCSLLTFIEWLIEVYTDLVHYLDWSWYMTWITLLVTFFLTQRFTQWFFKKKNYGKLGIRQV